MAVTVFVLHISHEACVIWICTDVQHLLVPIAEYTCNLMEIYDKLCTQFPSNVNKHNTTGHLQHPVRHLLNVWSSDLHVVSHTVATAANPARMMNRALKQQATELGPNMWQEQQGIANYDNKVPYFLIPSSQQFASQTAAQSVYGQAAGWITDISFTFLTKTFRLYQRHSYPVGARGSPCE